MAAKKGKKRAKKARKGPTAKAKAAYYRNIHKGYVRTRDVLLKHDPSFVRKTEGK